MAEGREGGPTGVSRRTVLQLLGLVAASPAEKALPHDNEPLYTASAEVGTSGVLATAVIRTKPNRTNIPDELKQRIKDDPEINRDDWAVALLLASMIEARLAGEDDKVNEARNSIVAIADSFEKPKPPEGEEEDPGLPPGQWPYGDMLTESQEEKDTT